MGVSIRKAVEDDLHKVYLLLSNSTLNSAWLPFDARKRMFRPVWGGEAGYYGYVMEDGDEVVGFLGLLFTEREVKGERHRFCEVHSWYVKEEYRKESMNLFLPAMSVKGATLVNYTPTKTVYEISKKFGWRDLETRLLMMLPVPTPRTVARRFRVETEKHAIVQYLDADDRRIFFDHESILCRHFLIRPKSGTDYCYVILKKMWLRPFVPFGRVMYVSNRRIFLDALHHVKLSWCLRLGLLFLVMDHDEVEPDQKPAFSRSMPREIPSLYKSRKLAPEDVKPPLYTLPLLLGYRLH